MKRLTAIIAAMAIVLLGTSGSALARGGHHHGHHGHHGNHHSGFHFSFGHGLHHSSYYGHYGHRSYYPSYSSGYYSPRYYSYSRPSYRTYRSYGGSYCYRPSVRYISPSQANYPPAQSDVEIDKPKVDPPPPMLPETENDLPNSGSTNRVMPTTRYTSLRDNGQEQSPPIVPGDRTFAGDGLGPQLSTRQARTILPDNQSPWVVSEDRFPENQLNSRLAVTTGTPTAP